eukprot:3932231-Rhodomonas_salina.3
MFPDCSNFGPVLAELELEFGRGACGYRGDAVHWHLPWLRALPPQKALSLRDPSNPEPNPSPPPSETLRPKPSTPDPPNSNPVSRIPYTPDLLPESDSLSAL